MVVEKGETEMAITIPSVFTMTLSFILLSDIYFVAAFIVYILHGLSQEASLVYVVFSWMLRVETAKGASMHSAKDYISRYA